MMAAKTPSLLLPTAYLPPIAYFQLLCHHKQAVVEQWESYPKQTLRNRTYILTANGVQLLSVPVVKPNGNHTLTRDIAISYSEAWNVRHWRAIVSAYNASPYFLYYRDALESILMQRHERLIELNETLISLVLRWLKMDCELKYSEQFDAPTQQDTDFRYHPETIPYKEKKYYQVFDTKYPFQPNLSILDLLFNMGPEAKDYLVC